MATHTDMLEDIYRDNRDNNLAAARKMQVRGKGRADFVPHIKRHIISARHWNHELIRLSKETKH